MRDDRDFIERANSVTGKLYGTPLSPEQVADNFALYGLHERTAALESFDRELRGEIDSGENGLRQRAQLISLRRQLGHMHDALRNAGR